MKKIAIFDADGNLHQIEADEVKLCAPTAKCIKFWAHLACAIIVVAIGMFFMIYQGTSSNYFSIGLGLLTLGVGVLIPSPNYKAVTPQKVLSSRPVTPVLLEGESEDFSRAPTLPDGSTESNDVIIDVRA